MKKRRFKSLQPGDRVLSQGVTYRIRAKSMRDGSLLITTVGQKPDWVRAVHVDDAVFVCRCTACPDGDGGETDGH